MKTLQNIRWCILFLLLGCSSRIEERKPPTLKKLPSVLAGYFAQQSPDGRWLSATYFPENKMPYTVRVNRDGQKLKVLYGIPLGPPSNDGVLTVRQVFDAQWDALPAGAKPIVRIRRSDAAEGHAWPEQELGVLLGEDPPGQWIYAHAKAKEVVFTALNARTGTLTQLGTANVKIRPSLGQLDQRQFYIMQDSKDDTLKREVIALDRQTFAVKWRYSVNAKINMSRGSPPFMTLSDQGRSVLLLTDGEMSHTLNSLTGARKLCPNPKWDPKSSRGSPLQYLHTLHYSRAIRDIGSLGEGVLHDHKSGRPGHDLHGYSYSKFYQVRKGCVVKIYDRRPLVKSALWLDKTLLLPEKPWDQEREHITLAEAAEKALKKTVLARAPGTFKK